MRIPIYNLFCFACLWLLSTTVHAQERVAMSFDFQLDQGKRPSVRVQIDKTTVLNFIIDTGAGASVLTESAALRLGLPSQLAFDEQNKPVLLEGRQARVVHVRNFTLGLMRFHMPFLIVSNDKLMTADLEPVDGLIGANLLQGYAALFDFTQRRITLYEGGKLTTQELEKAGMKEAVTVAQVGGDEGVFQVKGQVNNKGNQAEGIFLIDTGADCCFVSAEMA